MMLLYNGTHCKGKPCMSTCATGCAAAQTVLTVWRGNYFGKLNKKLM